MNALPRTGCRVLGAVLLLAGLGACAHGAPSETTVATHVAEAKRLAGSDLGALMVLCNPAPTQRPPQDAVDKAIAAFIARPAPPPGKAFDNLYFVGADWVSAWAITTPEGIILIDALDNRAEAESLIEGGLKSLGFDPARIKYIIVTHAHGDHYGGAKYLGDKYRPRIVMSDADWKQTEGQLEFTSVHWDAPPKRDVTVGDGDKVTLGGTAVTMNITPGHTHGTLTPTFDVRAGAATHRVLLWGGTAFNFGKDVPRLDSYIASTERLAKIAETQKIDVLISNHPSYDGSIAKLAALRSGAQPNPLVLGTPTVVRALNVMGECARAQRARFLMQP
jgi:metallo-beta-lactamase class B